MWAIKHKVLKYISKNKSTILLVLYTIFSILALSFLYTIFEHKLLMKLQSSNLINYLAIFALVLMLLIGYLLYRTSLLKEVNLQYQKIKYDQLKVYTSIIEGLTKDLRKRKHDYNNTLLALRGFIDHRDMDGLEKYFYNEIIKEHQKVNSSETIYLQLHNISDLVLKGLIATKLNRALAANINVSISIANEIDSFSYETADLCKIIGILLDNAIEAAGLANKKTISIALTSDQDEVNILILNTFNEKPNLSRIYEDGYSTKGIDRGLGLNIINKLINAKYRNKIKLIMDIKDDLFIQELTLKRLIISQ